MVDKQSIYQILDTQFRINGDYNITDTGVVNVDGSVTLEYNTFKQMPVKFGTVTEHFRVHHLNALETLEGAPEKVQTFSVLHCPRLTSLVGAPKQVFVFESTVCDFRDLVGFPASCEWAFLDYEINLPVLRLLQVSSKTRFWGSDLSRGAPLEVQNILNDERWKGTGKSGMLNCALELKKAGYAGNARW